MKKDTKHALIWGAVTVIIMLWLIMSVGCSNYQLNKKLHEEEGHFPGWIVEPHPPLYGPHNRQIELRNAYSDGWQDRGRTIQ